MFYHIVHTRIFSVYCYTCAVCNHRARLIKTHQRYSVGQNDKATTEYGVPNELIILVRTRLCGLAAVRFDQDGG